MHSMSPGVGCVSTSSPLLAVENSFMKSDSPPNKRRKMAEKKPPLQRERKVIELDMLAMASDSAMIVSPRVSLINTFANAGRCRISYSMIIPSGRGPHSL
jgi:hypothetical protein